MDSNISGMQAISAAELLSRYAAGERDFPEVDLRDADFRDVRTNVIENWEAQDEPEHLRTIRDRILNSEQPASKN